MRKIISKKKIHLIMARIMFDFMNSFSNPKVREQIRKEMSL